MLTLGRLRNLDSRGQLTLVGSGLAVIALVFFLYQVASRPSYTALATGLDPAEASDMAQALDATGVGYRLTSGGTELDVLKGQESRARVALAAEGLPRGGHVGFEIFDKKSLGESSFQQRVNYQRALEGEIARTIEEIDGVRSAQLQLVLPEEELFADEGSRASAAVLLSAATTVDPASIRGIAHLVASSVKGLDVDKITITDGSGALLWPTSEAAGTPSALTKLQAEQQYAAQLSAQIGSLLLRTLGPGKAEARVHARLNIDQTTLDKVTYAKKGVPLTQRNEEESLASTGGAPATAAGATSNVPGYAASASGSGESDYSRKNKETEYGVGKTVERTIIAPGRIERLDVALLVDASVPSEQVVAIRDAVSGLVGLDESRGDTLALSTLEFAVPEEAPAEKTSMVSTLTGKLALLKWVVLFLGGAVFLVVVRRGLRRREADLHVAEPTWLRQVEGAVPVAELEPPQLKIDPEQERREEMKGQVEEIVRRQPDKVALQVSQWLKE